MENATLKLVGLSELPGFDEEAIQLANEVSQFLLKRVNNSRTEVGLCLDGTAEVRLFVTKSKTQESAGVFEFIIRCRRA